MKKGRQASVSVSAPPLDNTTSLVISALGQWAPEIEAGAVLTIDPNKARLRILPLR